MPCGSIRLWSRNFTIFNRWDINAFCSFTIQSNILVTSTNWSRNTNWFISIICSFVLFTSTNKLWLFNHSAPSPYFVIRSTVNCPDIIFRNNSKSLHVITRHLIPCHTISIKSPNILFRIICGEKIHVTNPNRTISTYRNISTFNSIRNIFPTRASIFKDWTSIVYSPTISIRSNINLLK